MRTPTRCCGLALGVAWTLAAAGAAAPAAGAPETPGTEAGAADAGAQGAAAEAAAPRPLMREILEALSVVLPAAMRPERFGQGAEAERMERALATLAERADRLEEHADRRSAGFRHLADTLSRDAEDAYQRYREDRREEAAFLVQRLTENCLACHARLPSPRDTPLGEELVAAMQTEGLTLPERARLQMATRQFHAALDTWEELFRSPEVTPGQLDLMGYLGDYLTVAIRVTGDSERARATLTELASRDDVPDWLEKDLATWIAALDALRARRLAGRGDDPLAAARTLLAEAERLRRVPADHTGMVHDIVASSLLHRYVEAHPEGGREVAEAYYLLGLAEARIDRSYWVSQEDFYLEAAIRMAPDAPFAPAAFEALEQRVREWYTGSSGTHLPQDVAEQLEALRRLVESSQPPELRPADPA